MPTAQVVVTYEIDFKDEDIETGSYEELHNLAVSTPWTPDLAIQADIHLYDDNNNTISEDDEFFKEVHNG